MGKRVLLILLVCAAIIATAWAVFHYRAARRNRYQQSALISASNQTLTWAEAVERVKADRGESAGGAIEIPTELKHYDDRHWFLATQVAEVEKYKVQTCQDFLDLAAMIERGELVTVPAVTDSYVLFGVGQKADDEPFARFQDDHNIDLYDEAQLTDAYRRIDEKRASVRSQIDSLNEQSRKLKRSDRGKRSELQKQISAQQAELSSVEEDKALLDQYYGKPETRQKLFHDYESLQTLAKNFNGRSYDLNNPNDRYVFKINLLSSLKPQALKILEEVAAAYHRQFDRPLPVSSLVRPEQYQHALRRVNRNAVLIDTPPHSTGLAFDIDYRYMSGTEQTFVMAELAQLKNEGRIEAIRERNANYHVFAFVNGTRPSDDLIAASLDEATISGEEAHHASPKPKATKRHKATKATKRHNRHK
ncbi:MAG TPA: DUF5715 family protein [Pyrinomonadaceae bacterium]|nr:DUF5715 family protein [Pyrinomonadaceae bacterium]